jgi:PTS system nitrogen regulatory IIA component
MPMRISNFLSPHDAIVDVRAPDKSHLLTDLCTRAAASLNMDVQRVLGSIMKREALGSTGVGAGVAIPHGRVQDLKSPFGMLARLGIPIDFNSIDGQPVDLVFLLLLPGSPASDPLNALAAVARRLRDPRAIRDLRRAPDPTRLYRAITLED